MVAWTIPKSKLCEDRDLFVFWFGCKADKHTTRLVVWYQDIKNSKTKVTAPPLQLLEGTRQLALNLLSQRARTHWFWPTKGKAITGIWLHSVCGKVYVNTGDVWSLDKGEDTHWAPASHHQWALERQRATRSSNVLSDCWQCTTTAWLACLSHA